MKNNILYGLLGMILFLSSCTKREKAQVTNAQDYHQYLNTTNEEKLELETKNLTFWKNKYENQPNQYPYLSKIAKANNQLFATTGKIEYLIEAEENLKAQIKRKETSTNLRALARNYISQHRFQESLVLLKKAESIGDKLISTQKMLFDVHLELGNEIEAKRYLDTFYQINDFDYLIRAGKWNDTQGNLETAISFLERALQIAKSSNNKALKVWSYTNLGDFYGHNNEIEKSYENYLKSLSLEPSNAYAKKGIAWIAYSYEKNPTEAIRILNSIQKYHHSPDYYLFKAELAEFTNNTGEKEKNIQLFLNSSRKELYGKMYNQHYVKVCLEELNDYSLVTSVIQEEITNRPTPESYDLLAWAAFKRGNTQESLRIAKKYIEGKSHEPEVLYHLAEIYKANKMEEAKNVLKKELLDSSYELGPVFLAKIQKI